MSLRMRAVKEKIKLDFTCKATFVVHPITYP